MALEINPKADGRVLIPVGDYLVTVDLVRSIDPIVFAVAVGLSVEELESRIREWAEGDGLPYGVLA